MPLLLLRYPRAVHDLLETTLRSDAFDQDRKRPEPELWCSRADRVLRQYVAHEVGSLDNVGDHDDLEGSWRKVYDSALHGWLELQPKMLANGTGRRIEFWIAGADQEADGTDRTYEPLAIRWNVSFDSDVGLLQIQSTDLVDLDKTSASIAE